MPELAGGRLELDFPAEHVARLTLDHPARRNALDHEILDALAQVLPGVEARCVLLTATGPVFSAGYDIGSLDEAVALVGHPFPAALAALEAVPCPTVAALNGPALGGGLELALTCDLRLASDEARLGMPPARLGLVYSHTGLRKLVDAVGAPRARELLFTARAVSARTALQWGLVNELAAPDALAGRAVEYATQIAALAPMAQRGNKRVLAELLAARGPLGPEAEAGVAALRDAAFASEDLAEGLRAFAEKRPPRWRDS